MDMKRTLSSLLLLVCTSAALAAPRPVAARLLPPAAGDLAARAAVAVDAALASRPDVPRDAVAFTQSLRGDQALEAAAPFVARSREWFVEVSASELRAGVAVFTTRPEALVRVHAAARELRAGRGAELALDPQRLIVRREGVEHGAGSGMSLLVDAEQLAAAGAPFVEGTSAFRLKAELGAGRFELAVPDLRDDGRYVVHVFEPRSEAVLSLGTGRADHLHGETLRVEASLAGRAATVERAQGFVVAPGGRVFPLSFAPDGARLRGSLVLDALAAPGAGLWEVHLRVEGQADGLRVQRSARTAFACSLPTARLTGEAGVTAGASGLRLTLGIDAGSAGRYDVRGVLYGRDAAGQPRPLALAQSAAWLEPGRGELALEIDAALLAKSGLSAPYELRDLRLTDQGRMGLLHRQKIALVLP
jgi:hypothetical protein